MIAIHQAATQNSHLYYLLLMFLITPLIPIIAFQFDTDRNWAGAVIISMIIFVIFAIGLLFYYVPFWVKTGRITLDKTNQLLTLHQYNQDDIQIDLKTPFEFGYITNAPWRNVIVSQAGKNIQFSYNLPPWKKKEYTQNIKTVRQPDYEISNEKQKQYNRTSFHSVIGQAFAIDEYLESSDIAGPIQ